MVWYGIVLTFYLRKVPTEVESGQSVTTHTHSRLMEDPVCYS